MCIVLVAATLVWGTGMIYLLSHVERFAHVGGKLKNGAQWAEELVSNISRDLKAGREVATTISPSQQLINEESAAASYPINIVMQAQEDDLGGLISAVNSVVVNTKHLVHFYLIVPDDTTAHLQ